VGLEASQSLNASEAVLPSKNSSLAASRFCSLPGRFHATSGGGMKTPVIRSYRRLDECKIIFHYRQCQQKLLKEVIRPVDFSLQISRQSAPGVENNDACSPEKQRFPQSCGEAVEKKRTAELALQSLNPR